MGTSSNAEVAEEPISNDVPSISANFSKTDTYREDLWKQNLLAEIEKRMLSPEYEKDYILEDLREILLEDAKFSPETGEDELLQDEKIASLLEDKQRELEQLEKRNVSKLKWLRHAMAVKGLPPKIKRELYGPQHG